MSEFSNVKAYRNNRTEVLVFLNVLWTAKLSGHLAKFKGQERIMNITKVTKNITRGAQTIKIWPSKEKESIF